MTIYKHFLQDTFGQERQFFKKISSIQLLYLTKQVSPHLQRVKEKEKEKEDNNDDKDLEILKAKIASLEMELKTKQMVVNLIGNKVNLQKVQIYKLQTEK